MSESLGISIQTMCYQCQALTELCPECQEQRDARDAAIAHQIVDEGNLQYKRIWAGGEPDTTGHDWAGSISRISERTKRIRVVGDWNNEQVVVEEIDGDYRKEFLDPIAMLEDRLFDLETSVTITPAEVVCQACHLVYNKWSICPNCN